MTFPATTAFATLVGAAPVPAGSPQIASVSAPDFATAIDAALTPAAVAPVAFIPTPPAAAPVVRLPSLLPRTQEVCALETATSSVAETAAASSQAMPDPAVPDATASQLPLQLASAPASTEVTSTPPGLDAQAAPELATTPDLPPQTAGLPTPVPVYGSLVDDPGIRIERPDEDRASRPVSADPQMLPPSQPAVHPVAFAAAAPTLPSDPADDLASAAPAPPVDGNTRSATAGIPDPAATPSTAPPPAGFAERVAVPPGAAPAPSVPGPDAVAPPPAPIPLLDAARATLAAAPSAVPREPPTIDARAGRIGREMGVEIARRVMSGGDELTVRLNPAEMGRIEVRLSFDERGSLRAVVAADTVAALDLLRRDAADLGRALADAGVRADANSFRFDSRAQSGDGGGQPWHRQPPGAASRGARHADTHADASDVIPDTYRAFRTGGAINLMA